MFLCEANFASLMSSYAGFCMDKRSRKKLLTSIFIFINALSLLACNVMVPRANILVPYCFFSQIILLIRLDDTVANMIILLLG